MTHDSPRSALGLGLALFSGATFGTSGPFADSLMHTGWTPAAVVTFRITIAAVLLTPAAMVALRGRWGLLRRSLPAVLAYGLVAVAGCQLLFFNAVERLDVGVALLLEYSGILLVVIWMWARHGQRPRRLTTLGGVAALAGLVLVLQPASGGVDRIGVIWGACAAAGLAAYFVLSARIDDALPPIGMAWAAMVVGSLTLVVADVAHAAPFHMHTRDVVLAHHSVPWLVPIIGLSLIAAAIAYAAGIGAARLLGARLASFVGLSEVLFAVLFAWLLVGQRPGAWQLVGGAVVIVGIALVRAGDAEPAFEPDPVPFAEPVQA